MLHAKRNTANIRDIQPTHKLLVIQRLVKEVEKKSVPCLCPLKNQAELSLKENGLLRGMSRLLHVT